MLNYKCKKCTRIFKTNNGLFQHINRSHNAEKYYKKYIDDSVQKCNTCNDSKKFISFK